MKKTTIVAIVTVSNALLASTSLVGCGPSPDSGAKQTQVRIEQPARSNGSLLPGGSAAATETPKNTVVVLAAPSAPQLVAQQQAKLAGEREKVEAQLQELMGSYANNLGNAAGKAKYGEQITQQLEIYKRQSLQLYKLQRQAELAGNRSGAVAADSN
jgi:hypothetical protein